MWAVVDTPEEIPVLSRFSRLRAYFHAAFKFARPWRNRKNTCRLSQFCTPILSSVPTVAYDFVEGWLFVFTHARTTSSSLSCLARWALRRAFRSTLDPLSNGFRPVNLATQWWNIVIIPPLLGRIDIRIISEMFQFVSYLFTESVKHENLIYRQRMSLRLTVWEFSEKNLMTFYSIFILCLS